MRDFAIAAQVIPDRQAFPEAPAMVPLICSGLSGARGRGSSGGGGGTLMAEGVNPIEVGKKLHQHGDSLDRRPRGRNGRDDADDRHSRIAQICEAALLALVTITAAWAGYAAARWGTASRVQPRTCGHAAGLRHPR